jgi:hypothetical protein
MLTYAILRPNTAYLTKGYATRLIFFDLLIQAWRSRPQRPLASRTKGNIKDGFYHTHESLYPDPLKDLYVSVMLSFAIPHSSGMQI